MKVLFNSEMRGVLLRSPIEPAYRGSRRADAMRLRRTPTLRYVSVGSAAPKGGKVNRALPQGRSQDVDVANTKLDLSGVAQKKFSSVAIHSLWRIAGASGRARRGVCGLVSIMDDMSIQKAARQWIEFEPSCILAFFRGAPGDYFGNIETTVGADLILSLDSVDWGVRFGNFAAALADQVTATAARDVRRHGGG